MSSEFSGKVVLVAGGTGGLGHAVSLAFLRQGARVAVTFRQEIEFLSLKKAAAEYSGQLIGFNVDVTDLRQTEELVNRIVFEENRLDILVNAVGGYAGGKPLWELDPSDFTRMVDLNLRATYALAKSVLTPMLEVKSGVIVNIASKAAWDHAAGASVYAASKAGAVALIDSLAADLLGSGIRVNSILPSIIDTEATRKAMPNANFDKWPKPEEIAILVLFLASEHARVIHGASIPVFGSL